MPQFLTLQLLSSAKCIQTVKAWLSELTIFIWIHVFTLKRPKVSVLHDENVVFPAMSNHRCIGRDNWQEKDTVRCSNECKVGWQRIARVV